MLTWDDEDGEYNAGQLLKGRIEVQRSQAISHHLIIIFLQVHVKKTTKFRGDFLKVKIEDKVPISWSTLTSQGVE